VDDIRHISTNHAIEIYNEYNCTVSSHKNRIEQVVNNLLENATKYSLDSGKIKVHINKAENNYVAVKCKR
jgi:signal transduction histidine kinase